MGAQAVHVVFCDTREAEALVERNSMAGLNYGRGLEPAYDLIAIERHLAVSLAANKCELTMVSSQQLFGTGTCEYGCACANREQYRQGGGSTHKRRLVFASEVVCTHIWTQNSPY